MTEEPNVDLKQFDDDLNDLDDPEMGDMRNLPPQSFEVDPDDHYGAGDHPEGGNG